MLNTHNDDDSINIFTGMPNRKCVQLQEQWENSNDRILKFNVDDNYRYKKSELPPDYAHEIVNNSYIIEISFNSHQEIIL